MRRFDRKEGRRESEEKRQLCGGRMLQDVAMSTRERKPQGYYREHSGKDATLGDAPMTVMELGAVDPSHTVC